MCAHLEGSVLTRARRRGAVEQYGREEVSCHDGRSRARNRSEAYNARRQSRAAVEFQNLPRAVTRASEREHAAEDECECPEVRRGECPKVLQIPGSCLSYDTHTRCTPAGQLDLACGTT